jgi:hypothetical protein
MRRSPCVGRSPRRAAADNRVGDSARPVLHPSVRDPPHFLPGQATYAAVATLRGLLRPLLVAQVLLHAQGLFAGGARGLLARDRNRERSISGGCGGRSCRRRGCRWRRRQCRRCTLRRCPCAGHQPDRQQEQHRNAEHVPHGRRGNADCSHLFPLVCVGRSIPPGVESWAEPRRPPNCPRPSDAWILVFAPRGWRSTIRRPGGKR